MEMRSVFMSDKQFDKISARIRESYPNACILWIDEIHNRNLEQEHEDLYQTIISKRGADKVTKQELFHGTAESNIKSIATDGFQVSYSKIAAFGKGTYFSKYANYSINYSTDGKDKICYMFLCSVITGEPSVYGNMQEINKELHDNSVDSIKSPTMYITPYDYGGIPKYIIAFYKHAQK